MRPAAALRRRLVVASVILVLFVAVALNLALYVSLRTGLVASPGDTNSSLRRLLAVEVLATLLAGLLATVLFGRVASAILGPLEKMLDVVRNQTAGHVGERIRPPAECLFGVLGQAYDEMLDAQETAIAETQRGRDRSRRFLAEAADQVRKPIAEMQAVAETLLRRSPSDVGDDQQLLCEMLQETARVGDLVAELIQAAQLDEGVHLRPEACDIVALCRHEADRVQRLEPSLKVIVTAVGWNDQRPILDAKAVEEIVGNLLDNARRHARSRVEVIVTQRSGAIELRVADDGHGLPSHLAEAVFDRFVSLDGRGGSGLGLPIARQLARTQGGDVSYRDNQFVVSLPWVMASTGRTERRPGPATRPPVVALSP